jgi:hypothetical protein
MVNTGSNLNIFKLLGLSKIGKARTMLLLREKMRDTYLRTSATLPRVVLRSYY